MAEEEQKVETNQQQQFSEQEQKIIKYVIKNSPFGETSEVLSDLGKLLDNFDPQCEFIQNLLREHNEEHLAIAQGENDRKYITSTISFNDGYYIDQKNNQRLKIDFQSHKITEVEDIELEKNETFEEYRGYIDDAIKNYMQDYYKDGQYSHQIFIDWDDDSFTFYICITCKNLNLKNFYGGEWISEWKIDQNGMQGKIRVNSHYFEDGNVALKDVKNISDPITFEGGDRKTEAKNIVKVIMKHENAVQYGLEEMYGNMSQQFFKGMRRTLPITNQKMEWNLYAQKMRGNLN